MNFTCGSAREERLVLFEDALETLTWLRESGYQLLMRALACQGNVAEALRVFESLRTLLPDRLGVPYQRILPDTELIEFVCQENERDAKHLAGK